MHLSISDHSLVYMIRKSHYVRDGVRHIEARTMKNFNSENFLRELEQEHWDNVYCFEDPNKMWEIWKCILMATIDEHAPFRLRRVRNRKSPWITNDLRRQIFNRDYLKKKAVSKMILKLGVNIGKHVTKSIMQLKKLSALILLKTLIYIEVI